jgi:hypothetical protein
MVKSFIDRVREIDASEGGIRVLGAPLGPLRDFETRHTLGL